MRSLPYPDDILLWFSTYGIPELLNVVEKRGLLHSFAHF